MAVYHRSLVYKLQLSGEARRPWVWEFAGPTCWRLRVSGGWIYAFQITVQGNQVITGSTFVPDARRPVYFTP